MNPRRLTHTLTLAAALCAVTGCATAGGPKNPCGLVATAQDPFAGTMRGFNLYLDAGHYTAIGMEESQGSYTLKVLVVQRGSSRAVGAKGDKGEFAVGDRVLTFEAHKEVQPVTNASGYSGVFTQWIVEYALTRGHARDLARGPIMAVKVHVGPETHQFAPGADQAIRLQNSIACMTK